MIRASSVLPIRNSAILTLAVIGLVMALAGAVLGRLVEPVAEVMRRREPALRLDTMAAGGQGTLLALLGGFRGLVADALWLRMYSGWERQEIADTRALVGLVTSVDPRPAYFWLNGARILAYDVAAWRVLAAGRNALAEPARRQIEREQAQAALAYLDAAMPFHAGNPALWIERANIALNRLQDFEVAAEFYRRAWELPGGPYYAARLHAEALRWAGRPGDALAWLVRLHPTLPSDDESAASGLVLERIRRLERDLGVAVENQYRIPGP